MQKFFWTIWIKTSLNKAGGIPNWFKIEFQNVFRNNSYLTSVKLKKENLNTTSFSSLILPTKRFSFSFSPTIFSNYLFWCQSYKINFLYLGMNWTTESTERYCSTQYLIPTHTCLKWGKKAFLVKSLYKIFKKIYYKTFCIFLQLSMEWMFF